MKAKELNALVKKVKEKLGKQQGVGFMTSIGIKCAKVDDLGNYSLVKVNMYHPQRTYPLSIIEPVDLGIHNKKDFVKVAIKNGFNPVDILKSESPSGYIEPQSGSYTQTQGLSVVKVNRVNSIR